MDHIALHGASTSAEFDLASMYDNANGTEDSDSPFQYNAINCSYSDPAISLNSTVIMADVNVESKVESGDDSILGLIHRTSPARHP